MKRILTIVFLLVLNFTLKAQILQQPNTYGIGWKRTGADTLLYIPSDTLQVPSWGVGKTHIARKGTALYYWDGSKWSAITGAGSTYTAGNGTYLDGSQFKLGGTLTENTMINGNYNFTLGGDSVNFYPDGRFRVYAQNEDVSIYSGAGDAYLNGQNLYLGIIGSVSTTTGRKVLLHDTATGKVERIDPATLVTTPNLQQVLTAGSTLTTDNTIGGGGNTLNINNLWGLYIETGNGRGIVMDDEDGEPDEVRIYQTVNSANESAVELTESSVVLRTLKDLRENDLSVKNDSIFFRPSLGQMNIDSLRTWSGISDTTHKKPMTWDVRNGRWEYAENWYAPVTESNTVTLTNKRWTARVGSTTSSATPTINTDNYDIYKLTAQTADITSFTTNLSGTPVDGDILEIQVTGTAQRNITWGSSFVSTTVTLPTTTTSTNTLTVILQYYTTSSYGNNKWHCVNYY